ncbi:hypothetical protein HMPREF1624_05821 [Sporothrix schenckii ATCC 58251]|uniref:Major facilitator superfamily (MFS) profile domain-containing protein n=1 Tax=Sporothrix schenckii (strain ATCC 58251 / de Perez 2211183) TaxID=1391915 RepID=U7PT53_SPOS1|nr:hypothetical protein HMPREF1624_05821 [Sporothrix schenckii ATCC 58251]
MNIELDNIRSPEPAATSRLGGARTAPSFRPIRQKSSAALHRLSHRNVRLAASRGRDDGDANNAASPSPSSPAHVTYGRRTVPPADRGRGAYLVLAACSLAQAPIWGYSLSFGVFRQYYATHSLVDASPGSVTSIGTSQTGVMYLAVPVVMAALTRFPRLRPWCGPLGLVVSVASIAGSSAPGASASSSAAALIATQGVLYALGCALLFGAASLSLDDWFLERKGFAYGVMWAAKSTVGGGMPLLVAVLLERYGVETTLRGWAVASAVMAAPVLLFLRPRVPEGVLSADAIGRDDENETNGDGANNHSNDDESTGSHRPSPVGAPTTTTTLASSLVFFRRPLFWMLMVGNMIQSLGYQMPNTYLSAYAVALGLEQSTRLATYAGPLLLALFSVASVPGTMVMGMLGDRMPATTVVLISSIGSAVSVFALWYVSDLASFQGNPLAILIAFALAYGFFAGGFSSTWSAVLHDMKRRDETANTGLVFGMLMGGRGLGFVLSGPISGALLAAGAAGGPSKTSVVVGEYAPLILCTGTTAILGAWGSLWSLGRPCRRLARRLVVLVRGRRS